MSNGGKLWPIENGMMKNSNVLRIFCSAAASARAVLKCFAGVHGEDSRAPQDLRPDVRRVRVQLRLLHGPRQVSQRI